MDQRIADVVSWFGRIYLGGGPQLIQDETAFLSFVCMLAGIEALGGYRDPDTSGPGANGRRFQGFVTDYFPVQYHEHATNLCDFRNGMVHGFSPRQFALTHHNPGAHLRQTSDGAIALNAEDFYAAFLSASNSYFTAVSMSADLQAKFVRRLESKGGGSFAVGFVDVLQARPA